MNRCIFHDVGPGRQERRIFEIVERAYACRDKVLIFTQSEERAASIDRTLWIIKQEAFIPHKVFSRDEPDPKTPVGIVMEEINPVGAGILIADSHCSLEFASTFDSIHEFVDRSTPQAHRACQERYRLYRERKIPLDHVKEA